MERGSARWELDIAWPSAGVTRVYDLAHELAPGMPHHPNHPAFSFSLTRLHGDMRYGEDVSSAADTFTMGGHVGTHVDGLAHISKAGRVYGGHDITTSQSHTRGVGHNSIDELPPVVGPGHLVDAPRLFGRDLTPSDAIGAKEFERWFADHAAPRPGSVVCVRTGWSRFWQDPPRYLGRDTGLPGVDISGARWLAERGVAATGADTVDYNLAPDPDSIVHSYLIVERGIPILEMLNLEALAADQVHDFLFVAVPLPIRGGTGSPVRPLGLVSGGQAE